MSIRTSKLERSLIHDLESVEIKAWGDFTRVGEEAGVLLREIEGAIQAIVSDCDILAFNRVIGLGLESDIGNEQIEEIITAYRDYGIKRFFIQAMPLHSQSDLEQRLLDHGFEHYNNWVKLHRDAIPLTGVKSDLEVRRVGPEHGEDFARITSECFGWPESFRTWLAASIGRKNWNHYIAFSNDTPAATAAVYLDSKAAWVDFAATLPEFRGRGAQAALMKQRIDDAIAAGCRMLVVETSEQKPDKEAPSYRNMRRYGFEVAYTRPNYIYYNDI
jgi:ribosomal protein S18 acetylase RimI-like enzyme